LRIQADGGQIGPEYAATQRKMLETYLLKLRLQAPHAPI
jgi:hypothetical protein